MIVHVAISNPFMLHAGEELLITWDKTHCDEAKHHTKLEYLKIFQNGIYEVSFNVKWQHVAKTTQPLFVNIP